MKQKVKSVLITGAGSYIGTSFEKWVKENCREIETTTVDMRGSKWRGFDFHGYDAVFHVAGIAHADVGKVTEEQKKRYYRVNTDLTVECARKARAEGVRQFLFMSSMIVYGESGGIGKPKVITRDTPLAPENFYGDSKVKAEEGLKALETDTFKIVILRPPMIYGKGSKGNYPLLARIARRTPVFPKLKNERSMLYIGNLCKFVSLMIINEEKGIFFPQNRKYVRTDELVQKIAGVHGRKIHLTRLFNPLLLIAGRLGGVGQLISKAFGNMTYAKEISGYHEEYRIYELEESVRLTEV